MRTKLKNKLIGALVLFLAYESVRVFMVVVVWTPWNEPRTFLQKDDRGSFEISFFPDHRFLTRSKSEYGTCARAGVARGTIGRRVAGSLHYVDCPFLIKFHFVPHGVEMACIELETIKEKGPACTPPNGLARIMKPSLYHRLMGFTENGALYDTGEILQRVGDPDLKDLYASVNELAPNEDEKDAKQSSGTTRPR